MLVKPDELLRRIVLQNSSPRKLALTFAVGLMVGILPLVWGGTLVCMLFACLFRLNQAGIQAANYLAYPLQIALIIPFYRLGGVIFPWNPLVSTTMTQSSITAGTDSRIVIAVIATLKAVGAWLLVAPPVTLLLYLCLLPAVTRLLSRGEQAMAAREHLRTEPVFTGELNGKT